MRDRSAATLEILAGSANEVAPPDPIPDDRLKLLFVCAHPAIDASIHTPLMLQTVLGLDAVLRAIYAAWGPGWDDAAGVEARTQGFVDEAIWLARASVAPPRLPRSTIRRCRHFCASDQVWIGNAP